MCHLLSLPGTITVTSAMADLNRHSVEIETDQIFAKSIRKILLHIP